MTGIVTYGRLGRYGRFCNGAFGIASTIGVARKNGFDFGFPLWQNHDGLNFESDLDIDVYKQFVNPLPVYGGPPLPERFVDWGYWDVSLTESVSLVGHMQSQRFFGHCIDEVRFYMRMVDEPPVNDYCAIHFRGQDYSTEIGYHPRMTMDYYKPAMDLFHGARFLVFSDDIPAARQMFGDKVEYSEGRDYLEDFKLLKRCSHFIIANSSFSAFAAVLGDAPDKKVVAPRPWFGPAAGITGEDIYSDGWEVINWQ